MDLPHDHPAVAAFRAFSGAMRCWCRAMIAGRERLLRGEFADERELAQHRAEQRQEVEAIFREYCDAGPLAAETRSQSFTIPPDYDPETEILSVTQGRKLVRIVAINPATVDAQTGRPVGPHSQHRYTLVEASGRWLIRGRESTYNGGRTWLKDHL